MPLINDISNAVSSAVYGFAYQLLQFLASGFWLFDRMLIMVGYILMVINRWIATDLFQPIITNANASLRGAFIGVFIVAMFVLGLTYMLMFIFNVNIVVSPGRAILWLLAGMLFFQIGPTLFTSMQDFRGAISTFFYDSVGATVTARQGATFDSLTRIRSGSSDLPMFARCDNFNRYVGANPPPSSVKGMDVALAFLRADGIDVMGYTPPSGLEPNCDPHPGGGDGNLPADWYTQCCGSMPELENKEVGSYFDLEKNPDSNWWRSSMNMTPMDTVDAHRANSVGMAASGTLRLIFVQPIIFYGVAEQFVNILLTIAQGLTFISFAIAILFAFFRRTESLALAIIDQWIQLIIVTMVLSVISALITGLFMIGANAGNAFAGFGMAIIALIFTVFIILVGFKTMYNAANRLFDAVGHATGGSFVTVGQAAGMLAGGAAAVATGGATFLAARAVDDVSQGQALAMAVGATFSDNQAMSGAARMIMRLPGAQDTTIGQLAMDLTAGASFAQVGDALGGSPGKVLGGGIALPAYLRELNASAMGAERAVRMSRPYDNGFYDDDDGLPYGPMPPRRPRNKRFLPEEDGDDEGLLPNGGGSQRAKSGAEVFFEGVAVPSATFMPSPLQASDTTLDEAITGRINESLRAVNDDAQATRSGEHETVESRFDGALDAASSKNLGSAAERKADTSSGLPAGSASITQMDLTASNLATATSELGKAVQDIDTTTKLSQAKAPGTPPEDWQTGTIELKGRNQEGIPNVAALVGNALAQIQAERADSRRSIDGPVGIHEGKTALLDAAGIRPVSGTSAIEGPLSTLAWIAPLSRANEIGLSGAQLQAALNDLMMPRSTGISAGVRADLIQTASNFTDYPETSIRELENTLQKLPQIALFRGQINLAQTGSASVPTPPVEAAPKFINPVEAAQPLQSRATSDQPVQTVPSYSSAATPTILSSQEPALKRTTGLSAKHNRDTHEAETGHSSDSLPKTQNND